MRVIVACLRALSAPGGHLDSRVRDHFSELDIKRSGIMRIRENIGESNLTSVSDGPVQREVIG